eukprot:jgi/Psemu1/17780/gm1.17780_g
MVFCFLTPSNKLQLTRELKVERKAPSHPSIGGSKGYNLWYRREQMEKYQNGEPVNDTSNKNIDLFVACIIIYPQAQLDEIAMYLCNDSIGHYSNQLISQRLKELKITNKKPSIEAFKAYSPANIAMANLITMINFTQRLVPYIEYGQSYELDPS